MAGKLTVSTLNNDTGVLATQNGMTGIAKAWVNFDGTGTPAIRGSFNVSSITDNGTGNYTINFTTSMANANYAVCSSSTTAAGPTALSVTPFWMYGTFTTPTASAFQVGVQTPVNLVATDATYVMLTVFGS